MYIVVSHWRPIAGKDSEFEAAGRQARAFMDGLDGVDMIQAFRSGDEIVVVHAYRDMEAYSRIVDSEDGPFALKMAELNIEQYGEWLGSERGDTID